MPEPGQAEPCWTPSSLPKEASSSGSDTTNPAVLFPDLGTVPTEDGQRSGRSTMRSGRCQKHVKPSQGRPTGGTLAWQAYRHRPAAPTSSPGARTGVGSRCGGPGNHSGPGLVQGSLSTPHNANFDCRRRHSTPG